MEDSDGIELVGCTPATPGVADGAVCDTCSGEGLVSDPGHHTREKVVFCPDCGGRGGSDPAMVDKARWADRAYDDALKGNHEKMYREAVQDLGAVHQILNRLEVPIPNLDTQVVRESEVDPGLVARMWFVVGELTTYRNLARILDRASRSGGGK